MNCDMLRIQDCVPIVEKLDYAELEYMIMGPFKYRNRYATEIMSCASSMQSINLVPRAFYIPDRRKWPWPRPVT